MGIPLFLENNYHIQPRTNQKAKLGKAPEIRQLGFKQQPRKSQREVRRTRSRHFGTIPGGQTVKAKSWGLGFPVIVILVCWVFV